MKPMRLSSLAALAIVLVAGGSPLLVSVPSWAQNPTASNVIPGSAQVTAQAKITAIDPGKRTITLAGANGNQVTLIAGPAVRLEMLKVGDVVNAQYYRSVAFEVAAPTAGNQAPVTNDQLDQIVARGAQAPGGVALSLLKIQATVVGIDLAAQTLDVVNPSGGGIYTIRVTNPSRVAMLGSLQVGDTITAVVSQALAVSITPAPKRWF